MTNMDVTLKNKLVHCWEITVCLQLVWQYGLLFVMFRAFLRRFTKKFIFRPLDAARGVPISCYIARDLALYYDSQVTVENSSGVILYFWHTAKAAAVLSLEFFIYINSFPPRRSVFRNQNYGELIVSLFYP